MKIEFDPEKSEKNRQERVLPFEKAAEFDWNNAVYFEDDRNLYPERRFIAVGYLENRLHVLCFTPIPEGVRIISFRKANEREAKKHGKTITID
ncbi:MAG: BrnT family toxin [Prolixibacteraceae bacterium]|nr:BrnT family toxin [Prolixibacteraceae bacterium]